MNKLRNQVNLDNTLKVTTSSFAYKDPYQLSGGLFYKIKNRVQTFMSLRNIENEFVDFKTYNIDKNFKEINSSVCIAFSKRDKVRLQRSLSVSMFEYAKALHREKGNRINPFLKDVHSLKVMQARIYSENDHLLPEEQWAQLTVRLKGTDMTGENTTQFTVFERRLADKMDYYDWKISFLADEEDFRFINDPKF